MTNNFNRVSINRNFFKLIRFLIKPGNYVYLQVNISEAEQFRVPKLKTGEKVTIYFVEFPELLETTKFKVMQILMDEETLSLKLEPIYERTS